MPKVIDLSRTQWTVVIDPLSKGSRRRIKYFPTEKDSKEHVGTLSKKKFVTHILPPTIDAKKNPRKRGVISPGEAAQILSGLEDDKADFHSLRSDEVTYLLEAAKEIGYRAPKNAKGSKARYFYAYLQNRRVMRVRENPRRKSLSTRIRRPAQKRRRSGFPGYIVTFIVPDAMRLKRRYIGNNLTVVYKRNAAAVFSTTDDAKKIVRRAREWFRDKRIPSVTILQTNESASKFK